MKVRNPLPAIASDVWTRDVHDRIDIQVLQSHPVTKELVPYIVKGVDADGDGTFQRDEYGKFLKEDPDSAGNPCNVANGCALQVTAFYDFNGVYFHDGAQADAFDLLFTYHLWALNPRYNTDLRVLMGDNFTVDRRVSADLVATDGSDWQDPPVPGADPNLRASVRFTMRNAFARFYEATLAVSLWPQHLWERTGQRGEPAAATDIHGNLGCLVYPATASGAYTDTTKQGVGIPPGAPDLPSGCTSAFNYGAAESWAPSDADMIGAGPFTFDTWTQGSFARVNTYPDFFVGWDMRKAPPLLVDPYLPQYIKKPTIDGVLFKIYRSTTLGVLALGRAEIDFYHWNIPAEFVPDVLMNIENAIEANPEPGFFYMGYNMRRVPWGYEGYGTPAQRDVGAPLREAVSHLIDKESMVQNLIQNFGIVAHGLITPGNTYWYNDAIPKPRFDPALAASILDVQGWIDPPGECSQDTPSGCRSLPTIGTRVTEILTPHADYDPVRAAIGQMMADAFRSAGLNFRSSATAFGEIVARIDARNFDLYTLGWRIRGTDPDYLFNLFHSGNAAAGQNFPGYNDAAFDTLIDASRAELNRTRRQQRMYDAQLNLAANRPYEPLYYRTNIEAYRQDRFVNWSVDSGTIWNFWSLIGIRPPSDRRLVITPVLPSAVGSGGAAPLTVTVSDQDRNPISLATVRFQLKTPNTGSFGTGSTSDLNMTTNGTGQVSVAYHAPDFRAAAGTVLIDLTASYQDLDARTRTVPITIFPGPPQLFLAITAWLPDGDLMASGGMLPLAITVTDQDGFAVPNATVVVESDSAFVTVDPPNGTPAAMSVVTLRASGNVTAAEDVEIAVAATRPGFANASSLLRVVVIPANRDCPPGWVRLPEGTCIEDPGPQPFPPPWFIPAAVLAALVVVAVVWVLTAPMEAKDRPRP